MPALPDALGVEAAGVIEAVGPGVTDLVLASASRMRACRPAAMRVCARCRPSVLPLPDGLSDEAAAAGLLKGITVYMLLHRVRHVGAGDTVLVHAAAGGVGLLATHGRVRSARG